MFFNSYIFIFIFLPIVLTGYYLIGNRRFQLVFLLCSSLFFYAYWSSKYTLLLLFTVVLDFYVAQAMAKSRNAKFRRRMLLLSVVTNLSLLGLFKYYNLVASGINSLWVNSEPLLPVLDLILPIGISFYTFQSMSYVIDVYRGMSGAHDHLLTFAGYVTLFPHQVSGPLVRHNQIVPQLEGQSIYQFQPEKFWTGCYFFTFGLAKKVLIADTLAKVVDPLVGGMGMISNLQAWLALVGYTLQLYYDFSGYSDMAVGLGRMLNIEFPQNFNSPYKSLSVTEFWQRWHISLSSWLRDYLYIALGGSRFGEWLTYRNLLLTMVIGGFWHGANWTFAAWGLFHGSLLVVERFFRDRGIVMTKSRMVKAVYTMAMVAFGWVFFRAPSFGIAGLWFQKLFFLNEKITWDIISIATKYRDQFFAALVIAFITAFLFPNTWQIQFRPSAKHAALLAVLFVACLTFLGNESPFLYFQF